MTRTNYFAIGLFAALFLTPGAFQARESEALDVPIGGILAWWGKATDIPHGFEVCDGTVVNTPKAVLRGPKPNLQDRFVRGARDHRSFVPQAFEGGGSDTITLGMNTGAHALTVAELPSHSHSMRSHSHTTPNHSHAIAPHDHGMDHVHQVDDHTHTDGVGNAANAGTPGGGGSVSVLTPNASGTTQGLATPPLRTQTPIHPTTFAAKRVTDANTAALGTANDGGGGATSTEPASNTGTIGSGAGHSHPIAAAAIDNRPAYLDVIFIIRVK